MANFDFLRSEFGSRHSGLKAISIWLRRRLPTGLYGRSLLIIILPMVLLQTVVAAVFFERHWQLVTSRLSDAVTGDIAAVVELLEDMPPGSDYSKLVGIARNDLSLTISIEEGGKLPPLQRKPFFSLLDEVLSQNISNKVKRPFWIDTFSDPKRVDIRIKLGERILKISVDRYRTYASNSHIFLVWMVSTSLVLITIAILFLRGQIRPILTLAKAAESFGKGQKIAGYVPRGADEIRRAGLAFILMRERIERQLEQRTAMLSGVSHDLRTILTRFKLQLALAGDNPDLKPLHQDIEDMQAMLEGYLDFARGEVSEDAAEVDLDEMFARLQDEAELHGRSLEYEIEGGGRIVVKPNAFSRLVANLTSNARRYANHLKVTAVHSDKWLTVTFDDDGPGIPAETREDVFKPFFRMDEARNLDASGTGLGLTIARDIARAHGGNVTLDDSPMGGLRAIIKIPL
ncbi:ATP-binding protein [Rhizobium sp. PAMB 3182]